MSQCHTIDEVINVVCDVICCFVICDVICDVTNNVIYVTSQAMSYVTSYEGKAEITIYGYKIKGKTSNLSTAIIRCPECDGRLHVSPL